MGLIGILNGLFVEPGDKTVPIVAVIGSDGRLNRFVLSDKTLRSDEEIAMAVGVPAGQGRPKTSKE